VALVPFPCSQFVTLKHPDAYLQCLSKDPTALYEDFMSLSTTLHERHVLDSLRVGVPGLTVKKICEYVQRVDDIRVSELKYITVDAVEQGRAVVDCKNKTRVIFIPTPLRKILLQYIKNPAYKPEAYS
jgi:hypothetical protein